MNDKLKIQLQAIRERANDQLAGITKGRERVARDALALCNAVEQLSDALIHQQQENAASRIFTSIFGEPFANQTKH